jgi:hypothetical protein
MYLSKFIDNVIEGEKEYLTKPRSYAQFCKRLTDAFRNNEKFIFNFATTGRLFVDDFLISGHYDPLKDKKYIVFYFSSQSNFITLLKKEKEWSDFKFQLSITCQHELIHQHQWLYRDADDYIWDDMDYNDLDSTQEEDQEYLSDKDEIEAYAHDIAMEIRYYYNTLDPYEVLREIGKYKKVPSYKYYKRTFRGNDWLQIKKHLLKKVFLWLPYTT